MTGLYWPLFWTGETIVFVGTALVWFVPHRLARRSSRNAAMFGDMMLGAMRTGADRRHVEVLYRMSQSEWTECFGWHALSRRIQKVTVPLAVVLAVASIVRLVTL